jgi:hypothetical protein
MSIRPATIDRRGEQPCLPTGALLAVCERIAQGHVPTLRDRIVAALNRLRARIG